jgi:hypothetical protein
MPLPLAFSQPHLPLRQLLLLTVAVVVAHLALLGGIPAGMGWQANTPSASTMVASLITRTAAPEPAAKPVPAPAKPTQRASKPQPAPPPVKPPPEPLAVTEAVPESVAPVAPEAPLQPSAPDSAAVVNAPAPPPVPEIQPEPSSLAPAPAAASAAELQQARKVAYAEPMLLVYDGRGEEKGYIKYAARGELLWLPSAMQYQARLELSTFGLRLRTWTSKGELTEGGLQPTRFGDKASGAELATHFQRDKGIISFSANNPDVPLQAGAQDKLSAILQLSALLAGDPLQFPAGSAIRFQAAEAHRAEVWTFTVGATEDQELPGGTLSTRKLTKEPTVEFDQRIEVWLAPSLQHLPVRLRITEANGNFADLKWRKTQRPE